MKSFLYLWVISTLEKKNTQDTKIIQTKATYKHTQMRNVIPITQPELTFPRLHHPHPPRPAFWAVSHLSLHFPPPNRWTLPGAPSPLQQQPENKRRGRVSGELRTSAGNEAAGPRRALNPHRGRGCRARQGPGLDVPYPSGPGQASQQIVLLHVEAVTEHQLLQLPLGARRAAQRLQVAGAPRRLGGRRLIGRGQFRPPPGSRRFGHFGRFRRFLRRLHSERFCRSPLPPRGRRRSSPHRAPEAEHVHGATSPRRVPPPPAIG